MYPLTTEKRNREQKKLFFFSTLTWPVSLYYKCIIYSSSLSVFSLFMSLSLVPIFHLLIGKAICVHTRL